MRRDPTLASEERQKSIEAEQSEIERTQAIVNQIKDASRDEEMDRFMEDFDKECKRIDEQFLSQDQRDKV